MVFGTENTLAVGERGKGSGDGCWLLEGKNDIGAGGERFAGANRESAARRDRSSNSLTPSPIKALAHSNQKNIVQSHRSNQLELLLQGFFSLLIYAFLLHNFSGCFPLVPRLIAHHLAINVVL